MPRLRPLPGVPGRRDTGTVEPPFTEALKGTFEAAGGSPFAQVATVSPDGLPEVRTVVLRGLGEDGDAWFASDARSAKFRSLAANPWLELCLFDAAAGVQWRLLGRVAVHAADGHARQAWGALSRGTQALFHAPPPGGQLEVEAAWRQEADQATRDGAPMPESFALVRLPPVRCDQLALGPPLRRRLWQLTDGTWIGREVVP